MARAGLGEAAPQRRGLPALPARALILRGDSSPRIAGKLVVEAARPIVATDGLEDLRSMLPPVNTLRYVGPREIRERCAGTPEGTPIRSRADLTNWLAQAGDEDHGWATFVVNIDAALLLAPRRSEHVACAGGRDVLAAGELQFDSAGVVREASNQSTGYCPPESSWAHLQTALDRAGIARPSGFTFEVHFRRCPKCGERNLVKDDWYVCTFCDEDLPVTWNFDQDAE